MPCAFPILICADHVSAADDSNAQYETTFALMQRQIDWLNTQLKAQREELFRKDKEIAKLKSKLGKEKETPEKSTSSPSPSPSKASSTGAVVGGDVSLGSGRTKASSESKPSQTGTDSAQQMMDQYYAEVFALLQSYLKGGATKSELVEKVREVGIPDPSVPKPTSVSQIVKLFGGGLPKG